MLPVAFVGVSPHSLVGSPKNHAGACVHVFYAVKTPVECLVVEVVYFVVDVSHAVVASPLHLVFFSFFAHRALTRRYCVNAASLAFKAGQGENQGPSHGLAAGLLNSISKRLRRKKEVEEPPAMAPSTAA